MEGFSRFFGACIRDTSAFFEIPGANFFFQISTDSCLANHFLARALSVPFFSDQEQIPHQVKRIGGGLSVIFLVSLYLYFVQHYAFFIIPLSRLCPFSSPLGTIDRTQARSKC